MIILVILAFAACFALFTGFLWMIGLGILASIFHAPNLAIGYWESVLVSFVVNFLLGLGFRGSSK